MQNNVNYSHKYTLVLMLFLEQDLVKDLDDLNTA